MNVNSQNINVINSFASAKNVFNLLTFLKTILVAIVFFVYGAK